MEISIHCVTNQLWIVACTKTELWEKGCSASSFLTLLLLGVTQYWFAQHILLQYLEEHFSLFSIYVRQSVLEIKMPEQMKNSKKYSIQQKGVSEWEIESKV